MRDRWTLFASRCNSQRTQHLMRKWGTLMRNLMRNYQINPKWGTCCCRFFKGGGGCILQDVNATKDKSCENIPAKEPWQLNATWDTRSDPLLEGKNSIKHIIRLIGKQMVDWLKYCINVKITEIHNCTVIMSLNTAVFRSKGLGCM